MSVFFTRRGKAAERVNYVPWIESTGTQWVDSEFVPNQDTRVVVEVINYKQNTVFGARSSSYSNTFTLTSSGGYYRTDYNTVVKNIVANPILDKMVIDKNKNVTNFNGTVITHDYAAFTCPGNLYIFAMNNNGNVYDYGEVGICSMQIYDKGTLARDYWPCYDPDGIACLYDRVGRKYYYNKGSGEFVVGGVPDSGGGDVIKTISFTVGGRSYTADEGMTWAQFIASGYNPQSGFYASGSRVMHPLHGYVYYEGSQVKTTDTIIANAAYTTD